jgi:molybdate transport system ATP-binding protein
MRGVTVAYGRHVILDHIDWQVRPGEHWAVLGANGSGKSTLLSLISQDHPQAYASHITLFGQRKGSGETVADLRRHIGVVSSRFQTGYRKHLSGADVVVSGFFDSIGLYRRPRADQRAAAARWLRRLELQDLAQHFFDQLSYGQRRLILIARAVVKAPRILVLDEPCQGLDPRNRRRIGRMLEVIATTGTTLLYATHHRHELPCCISRVLVLDGRGKASVHASSTASGANRGDFN